MYTAAACLISVFVWILMAGHARYRNLSPLQRRMFCLGAAAAVAAGAGGISVLVRTNTLHPPEWDMLIFWINGQVASRGHNYYDPALAARLAAPFHPSPEFVEVAVGMPFKYPPPSIFWFIPLGWFDIHTAAAVWFGLNLACLAAAIVILSRTFLGGLSGIGLLFTSALALTMYGTYSNIKTAQTVFLLLVFLSLAFRSRNNVRGGVWLALAILVKPFMAIVGVYALVFRKWRPLAGTAATLLATALASLVIFGRTVFTSYFAVDFSAIPMSQYTELQNQSLLAWILRITHSPVRFPLLYLILVAIIGATFLWRLGTAGKRSEASGFALALTFALLVYPASLRSYSAALILPVLVLYKANLRWPAAVAYGFMWLAAADYSILATLTVGIVLAIRMPVTGS
jgi:hypothetical protein